MTRHSQDEARQKGDKALVLHEAGMARGVIAERLAVSAHNVAGMIQRARQRREKVKETAE